MLSTLPADAVSVDSVIDFWDLTRLLDAISLIATSLSTTLKNALRYVRVPTVAIACCSACARVRACAQAGRRVCGRVCLL